MNRNQRSFSIESAFIAGGAVAAFLMLIAIVSVLREAGDVIIKNSIEATQVSMWGYWLPVVSGIIAITVYNFSKSSKETSMSTYKVCSQNTQEMSEAQYTLKKILTEVEDKSKSELVRLLGNRFQIKKRQVTENSQTIHDYQVIMPNIEDYAIDMAISYVSSHFNSARVSIDFNSYTFLKAGICPTIRVSFKKSAMIK